MAGRVYDRLTAERGAGLMFRAVHEALSGERPGLGRTSLAENHLVGGISCKGSEGHGPVGVAGRWQLWAVRVLGLG